MKHSKKKKRSRPTNQVGVKGAAREGESEERRVVKSLMESFTSVSIEEASSAYREANGDPSKAAEILGELLEIADDQATSCSGSSSSLGPSSAEVFMDANCGGSGVRGRGFRGTNKQKKVIASTGTVSTILGKEYGYAYGPANKGDAEQFLCSMLGDDCELSMAVVRDVLCTYSVLVFIPLGLHAYRVNANMMLKRALSHSTYQSLIPAIGLLTLATLYYLDISKVYTSLYFWIGPCLQPEYGRLLPMQEFVLTSCMQSKNGQSCERTVNNKEDTQYILECSDNIDVESTTSMSNQRLHTVSNSVEYSTLESPDSTEEEYS
ncbi:hypothetical protein CsSME_00016208 [Camellia sinensis var. sinensis]